MSEGRKESDSVEAKLHRIADAVNVAYGRPRGLPPGEDAEHDMYVIRTFEDAVIAKDYPSDYYYEIPYSMVGDSVVLGKPAQVESYYVLKRLMAENPRITMKEAAEILSTGAGAELTGPIVFKNEAERIAFAAVLVPGEPDLDFDQGEKILTKQEVERVANQWLADYGNIDLMHSLNNVAVPVQSYTTYSERTVKTDAGDLTLPEGTWILGSRLNEETWKAVIDGKLTGYSVMGIRRTALKNLASAEKSSAEACLKRTLIRDLGPDWVAPFVSVVDAPAVPKSKWFALKFSEGATGAGTEANKSWYKRIKEVVSGVSNTNIVEKEGRRYSDTVYQRMKLIFDTVKALMEEADAERKGRGPFGKKSEEVEGLDEKELKNLITTIVQETMPEALKGVSERLGKLEKPADGHTTKEGQTAGPDEEFRGEIVKRLEKLESVKSPGGTSKALKGQDGDSTSKPDEFVVDRDLYGRKRKGGRS